MKKALKIAIPIVLVAVVLGIYPCFVLVGRHSNKKLGIVYDKAFLHQTSAQVETFDAELHETIDRLHVVLKRSSGIGLAAPQIGVLQRVVLIKDGSATIEAVNPEIIHMSNRKNSFESCLSISWRVKTVKRYSRITIRAQDRNGAYFEKTLSGMGAFVASHEIDHLDGILFTDAQAGTHRAYLAPAS